MKRAMTSTTRPQLRRTRGKEASRVKLVRDKDHTSTAKANERERSIKKLVRDKEGVTHRGKHRSERTNILPSCTASRRLTSSMQTRQTRPPSSTASLINCRTRFNASPIVWSREQRGEAHSLTMLVSNANGSQKGEW